MPFTEFGSRCRIRSVLSSILLTVLSGCGLFPDAPGWKRAGQAAVSAAVAPATWLPLAGAAVFRVDDFDRRVSDWGIEHTPLFASPENADRASDWLFGATVAAYGGTLVAGNAGAAERWATRWHNAAIGGATALTTGGTTLLLKEAVGRERPDGSEDASFPSLHAAGSTAFATLASRNLADLPLSGGQRTLAGAGLGALTLGTAWARIEAGQHYPSDVLAGAALGHFFALFFTEAFAGESSLSLLPEIGLKEDRVGLAVQMAF
jgi:membrane-associated phospholipid phosphatase